MLYSTYCYIYKAELKYGKGLTYTTGDTVLQCLLTHVLTGLVAPHTITQMREIVKNPRSARFYRNVSRDFWARIRACEIGLCRVIS